jgi:hypothetical protein
MNIYNEQGDMTNACVSKVAGEMARSISALITDLLARGTPVVEVRAMLEYIDTEMKYAATLCLMEHRMKDVGGWPVPVEVYDKYPACSSEDCPHHKECANHTSASLHRTHGGDTPILVKMDSEWLCTKCPESRGRGAILIDGTYMDKDE